MRVGVFTPLLSQLPLQVVVQKLAELRIDTVELGTGNYVGDAHCKLSMLENPSALAEFKKVLGDHGVSISALSCHGNALHPERRRLRSGTARPAARRFCWPRSWAFRRWLIFPDVRAIRRMRRHPTGSPARGLPTTGRFSTGSGTRLFHLSGLSTPSLPQIMA